MTNSTNSHQELSSIEIQFGKYLNDMGEIDFPQGLPENIKKLYDATINESDKFVAIYKKLGRDAVSLAMKISNESIKQRKK